jgi:hypothetical protein
MVSTAEQVEIYTYGSSGLDTIFGTLFCQNFKSYCTTVSRTLWANQNYISHMFHIFGTTDCLGFEVLMVVSAKMTVFWVVVPCSLVEVYQRFRGLCCLHPQGDE